MLFRSDSATAFGMFAAFSIIRFRRSVSQSRDIGFIFLAMAAGLATLEKLTPNLYRELDQKGAKWAAAFEKLPGLHAPRVGSLIWPLFQDGVKRADRVETGSITRFNRFHGLMLEQGIYLPPSGYEVAFLSAAHGDEELAHFERAIGFVAAALKND